MKYQVYNVETGKDLSTPFLSERGAIAYISAITEFLIENNLPESKLDYRVV